MDLPGHGISLLPLGDLHGDAAHVAAVVAAIEGPVVLVGHSYGGAVITQAAGTLTNVTHLVYVTAFALDAGESVMGLLTSLPPAHVVLGDAMQIQADGSSILADRDTIVAALYAQSSPAAAEAAIARLSPQPAVTFTQPVTESPRDTIPSTYIRCTLDAGIDISHQDVMSARCVNVVTLVADHSPFLAMPGAVADIVEPLCR